MLAKFFLIGLGCLVILAAVLIVVLWIVTLTRWKGGKGCDESQCDSCPFPCEKHQNNKWRF